MDILVMLLGFAGAFAIFGIAAYLSLGVICAVYPEEQHGTMLRWQRVMVIIALVVGVLGFGSGLMAALFSSG